MITTIQIENVLKEKLDKLKVHHRETYNELIVRLIAGYSPKNMEKESLVETIETLSNPEEMREIAESMERYEKGDFISLDQLKKELKINA